MFRTLSYLLVGVRPVEAQEEVGGLAVQEEIGCPERDGKASDGVAEVERDPEVLGVCICEDVLQRKEQLEWAWWSHQYPPAVSAWHAGLQGSPLPLSHNFQR